MRHQKLYFSIGYIVFILILSTSCMMMHNMHNNIEKRDTRGLEDPVCGMQLDKDTALAINYEGSTFYFDSEECLKVFQKSPEQFVNKDMKTNNRNSKKRMSAAAIMGGAAMVAMMVVMILTMDGGH